MFLHSLSSLNFFKKNNILLLTDAEKYEILKAA